MNKKLFSAILAAAFVGGSAATTAAFDLNTKEANDYDLLAFYSGRQTSATQTYMDFLSPSGSWRIRNVPSLPNYNFFNNQKWTAGAPSLFKALNSSPYELSFSQGGKQLGLAYAHKRDFLYGDSVSDRYSLNTTGQYSFGDYYAATGFSYTMALSNVERVKNEQRVQKNLGVFMEAGKRIANLSTGLMYMYVSGDDAADGNAFRPFYLLTVANSASKDGKTYLDQAQAISLYAGYDFGSQLNLRGGLGIAKVDERAGADRLQKEESYRWSVNLDANYKLLDNLVYEAHFGFLDSGDLFDDPASNVSQDTNLFTESPVYRLTNQLTMTF